MIGNLNLYFDAQPIKDWRALVEIRFTNAPQGLVTNYGGLAGTYERVGTRQNDPHAAQLNAPMWRGSTVIERAWIEWNRLQLLKVRVGNWFTPFGIWNEDHGTPTLISPALPQFMLQGWMPVRQTGVMAHGNTFSGDGELGYAATFSNGRQELSNSSTSTANSASAGVSTRDVTRVTSTPRSGSPSSRARPATRS